MARINVLSTQNLKFFMEFYKKCTLKKCIEGENLIKIGEKMDRMYFIYNGKVGMNIPKFREMFENFNVLLQGSEFGYNCYINDSIAL